MKRLINFPVIAAITLIAMLSSCDDKRSPGSVYMPDMAYSRTYEAYDLLDSTLFTNDMFDKGGNKIYFNGSPASGTIKRGEMFPYTLPNDSAGYAASAGVQNPLGALTAQELEEAGRLYNINCGVCHGAKGAANGPLAGKVGGIINLTLDQYKQMADGTMFHSITYGKNNMGSYASQIDRKQRWMVIKYVRTLQGGGAAKADSTSAAKTAAADNTAKPM
jgi:mono/diheme cytochrome c family protein